MTVAAKIGKHTFVTSGKVPFVRFEVELYAIEGEQSAMWERSLGWRLINGYVSPPSFRAPRGYSPLLQYHPAIMTNVYNQVALLADDWVKAVPTLAPLKELETATEEACLADKYLKKKASL